MLTNEILPNDPILVKLLEAARLTNACIIHDYYGFDKTYAQLLADIIATREAFRCDLPASVLTSDGLLTDDRPYVIALTHGGYEFIVAFFAIRAIGGACFPLSAAILREEAAHYISDSRAVGILAGRENMLLASEICSATGDADFVTKRVSANALPVSVDSVIVSSSLICNPQGPGIVILTSGTTGKPKAVILPRQCLVERRPAALGKAALSHNVVYWRGGLADTILPVISGHKLYSLKERDDARVVWEVLRKHYVTLLIFSQGLLRQMKEVYEEHLAGLEESVRAEYLQGVRNLGSIRHVGTFLAPALLKFWTDLTGMPLKNGYGQTECGGMITEVDVRRPSNVKLTVGIIVDYYSIEVKLENGDNGEFLVKSEWMMTGYMNNTSATMAAFNEDGYLKTGDIGHIEEGEYVFEGRANDDFIDYVPRLPVEIAINNLIYVYEAHVLLVPDYEERAVVGALIRVKKDAVGIGELKLARLHEDLANTLPAYMRPYLLRVVSEEEQIPYTASQKPDKRLILERFFGVRDFWLADKPTPGVQVWPVRLGGWGPEPKPEGHKPWDYPFW